ncbi:hypothetical protein J8I87_12965 [Paraburkholderia sp. LEh10]|nr:hypothetical protein [Paraburkholderia sp. LEh10]
MKAGADHSIRNAIGDAQALQTAGAPQRGIARRALAPSLLIVGVCGWSLIETPAEFDPSAGEAGVAALAIAKFAWAVIGVAAARGVKRAQWLFSFLCGLSLVAIVPALPVEFNESAWIFCQSLVECALKAAAMLALVFSRAPRPAGIEAIAWNDEDSGIGKP